MDDRDPAVDLFDAVRRQLERTDRVPDDDAAMVHMAHAYVHHWAQVGGEVNLARGEWQVSRVYSVIRRGEPALWHARRCLDLCTRYEIADWDLAYAHEAMARAYSVLGDEAACARHVAAAREVEIAEGDDRELLEKDLATIAV